MPREHWRLHARIRRNRFKFRENMENIGNIIMTLIQIIGIPILVGIVILLVRLFIKFKPPTEIWVNGWMKKTDGWVKWGGKKSKRKIK